MKLTKIPEQINRKTFFRILFAIAALYLSRLWYLLIKDKEEVLRQSKKTVKLALPQYPGISFHEEIILNTEGDEIIALSAKCPHLGCLINKEENSQLLCPCHGSRFHKDGRLLQGPAQKDLTRLNFKLDKKKKELHFEIEG